jgi:hypothetical protein
MKIHASRLKLTCATLIKLFELKFFLIFLQKLTCDAYISLVTLKFLLYKVISICTMQNARLLIIHVALRKSLGVLSICAFECHRDSKKTGSRSLRLMTSMSSYLYIVNYFITGFSKWLTRSNHHVSQVDQEKVSLECSRAKFHVAILSVKKLGYVFKWISIRVYVMHIMQSTLSKGICCRLDLPNVGIGL